MARKIYKILTTYFVYFKFLPYSWFKFIFNINNLLIIYIIIDYISTIIN